MNDAKLSAWLQEAGFDPTQLDPRIGNRTTPLMHAARLGRPEVVAAGADPDNQNVNGATALTYCASAGKAERVRQLLAAGADVARRTLDGYTALDACANLSCLRLLRAAAAP